MAQAKIWTEVGIGFDSVVSGLSIYNSKEEVMRFVLMIDEEMCNLQWTKDLRDALNDIIAIEEK